MPTIVDTQERRAHVVAAAADLVAEGGLGALTFRALANRLGCSTTMISHYFADKSDVLREIYRAITAEAVALRNTALTAGAGSPAEALEALLPIAPQQRRIWQLWLCFWTSALFDPALIREHRIGLVGTRERVRDHMLAQGSDRARADAAAEAICSTLFGIALQALFDDRYWTPDIQRAAYRRTWAAADQT